MGKARPPIAGAARRICHADDRCMGNHEFHPTRIDQKHCHQGCASRCRNCAKKHELNSYARTRYLLQLHPSKKARDRKKVPSPPKRGYRAYEEGKPSNS